MTFNKVPLEINQNIGSYLNDKDLCSFRAACHTTKDAVDGHNFSFWRGRFLDTFDPPLEAMTSVGLKELYQYRQKWLTRGAQCFGTGYWKEERLCSDVLKGLALDSQPYLDENNMPVSSNLTKIIDFCRKFPHFLGCIFKPAYGVPAKISTTIQIAQILVSSLSLDPYLIPQDVWQFGATQKLVYQSPATAPIFKGVNNDQVNILWVLHVINFFRYHCLRPVESTLHRPYAALEASQRPVFWKQSIDNDAKPFVGQVWKGTYAYLDVDEVNEIRRNEKNRKTKKVTKKQKTQGRENSEKIFIDRNVDMGKRAMQTVKIYFPPTHPFTWPARFERHLNGRMNKENKNAERGDQDPVSFRFEGVGFDDEEFYATGYTYPLPAQHGVPGWQRIVMMKYFLDDNGNYEEEAIWAYEGVVLPGGQLIVGRWWAPDDNVSQEKVYSGPFIFWNIDPSVPPDERGPEFTTGFDMSNAL